MWIPGEKSWKLNWKEFYSEEIREGKIVCAYMCTFFVVWFVAALYMFI